MQKLTYQSKDTADCGDDSYARYVGDFTLFTLPVVGLAWVMLAWIHWFAEPFGDVRAFDVAVFIGGPVFQLGAIVAWWVLGYRRRFPVLGILAMTCWFLLLGYLSVNLMLPYFREPWNY